MLLILIIAGLILPLFSFTQTIKMPGTLEEGKSFGWDIIKNLPQGMGRGWQDFLTIWQKIWNFIKNIWQRWFQSLWEKILSIFGKEVERRKEIIKQEFPKEKEEIKKEAPELGKSLWERFKELIK